MKPKFEIRAYDRMGNITGSMLTRMTEDAARASCAEILRLDERTTYIELYHYVPNMDVTQETPIVILPELPF